MRRVPWLFVTVVIAITAAVASAGSGRHGFGPVLAAAEGARPDPESAVRQIIEATGAAYAGDCGSTRSPDDAGKICSRFVEQLADVRAYLIGRTFSEFSRWVFVEHTPDGWRDAGAAELDFFVERLQPPWPDR